MAWCLTNYGDKGSLNFVFELGYIHHRGVVSRRRVIAVRWRGGIAVPYIGKTVCGTFGTPTQAAKEVRTAVRGVIKQAGIIVTSGKQSDRYSGGDSKSGIRIYEERGTVQSVEKPCCVHIALCSGRARGGTCYCGWCVMHCCRSLRRRCIRG